MPGLFRQMVWWLGAPAAAAGATLSFAELARLGLVVGRLRGLLALLLVALVLLTTLLLVLVLILSCMLQSPLVG